MKNHKKTILTLLAISSLLCLLCIEPIDAAYGVSYVDDELKDLYLELVDSYPFKLETGKESSAEVMSQVHGWANELKATSTEHSLAQINVNAGFNWTDAFSFANTDTYFEGAIFTEEEIHDMMRNRVHQLLYGDLEVACQVSILDVMLLRALDAVIIEQIKIKGKNIEFMGYCNGMSQAARDFYLTPSLIPLGQPNSNSLPHPNPNFTIEAETGGNVVHQAILEYVLWKGSAAFFNPNHLYNWVHTYLGLDAQADGTHNALAFQDIAQWMLTGDFYEPVVVLLTARVWVEDDPGTSHFVLAYDYETHSNGSIQLFIYDNRQEYTGPDDMYDDWIMLDPNGEFQGTKRSPNKTWHIMCAYKRTVEYNSLLTTLIQMLPKILSLLALSPVDVSVTDPLGRKIGVDSQGETVVEFPAIYTEGEDDHTYIAMPFTPGIPYTIELTGTGEGDYTFQASRFIDGKVDTKEYVGETSVGESDVYSVSLNQEMFDLAKQGVKLYAPVPLSGTRARLNWTAYNEPGFEHYEIWMSQSLTDMGSPLDIQIDDAEQTSHVVTGLEPENTYFFTVRVNTTEGLPVTSNRVGVRMPEGTTWLVYAIAGAAGVAAVLIVLVLIRRRRQS